MGKRNRIPWPKLTPYEKRDVAFARDGYSFEALNEYRLTKVPGGWICEHLHTGFTVGKERARRALLSCFYHVHVEPSLDKSNTGKPS